MHNDAPIFGFDVIAGKNIITGCFHDYSVTVNKDHDMCIWFAEHVKQLSCQFMSKPVKLYRWRAAR